jgi:hypothetical protein
MRRRARPCESFFNVQTEADCLKQERMITKNLGMLLLAIYLILVGIVSLFHVPIGSLVIGIVALVAGVLILLGR